LSQSNLQQLWDRLAEVVKAERESERAIAKTRPILDEVIAGRRIESRFLRPVKGRPAAYLVYRPPDRSFSVISMVWDAGQRFPIHDHLSWGLIGVYENGITEERFERLDDGSREGYADIKNVGVSEFKEGQILAEGLVFDDLHRKDIHRIMNPSGRKSVSIHILASDLGMRQRHQYDPDAKTVRRFVSGYDDPEGKLEGRVVGGSDRSELLKLSPHEVLDTRGLSCPHPTLKTAARLAAMRKGQVLEVLTDSEDSAYDEIPAKLKSEGIEFVSLELPEGFWKVRMRR
jgi:3-mercaptopropionate dioxygenase